VLREALAGLGVMFVIDYNCGDTNPGRFGNRACGPLTGVAGGAAKTVLCTWLCANHAVLKGFL
jgi:hypothetical protein